MSNKQQNDSSARMGCLIVLVAIVQAVLVTVKLSGGKLSWWIALAPLLAWVLFIIAAAIIVAIRLNKKQS